MDISRRAFMGGAAALWAAPGFPLVDYHCHLEPPAVTLERAAALSRERGVKFGIVEHAGPGQAIANDRDLDRYLAGFRGLPFYRGIQAEGVDWMRAFSKAAMARLDYVLSDALKLPEPDGRIVKIWTPEAEVRDKREWMERYVAFNVRVIEREPIDILANPTFLPAPIEREYDELWTSERMRRIIDAAVRCGVAIEINARYRIPRLPFLKMAKSAGLKFSFGSNVHGADIGKLDYCLEVARQLGLTRTDMFVPAPPGKKPIQVRG